MLFLCFSLLCGSYRYARGVPKDMKRSVAYLQQAADLGYSLAQNGLAVYSFLQYSEASLLFSSLLFGQSWSYGLVSVRWWWCEREQVLRERVGRGCGL